MSPTGRTASILQTSQHSGVSIRLCWKPQVRVVTPQEFDQDKFKLHIPLCLNKHHCLEYSCPLSFPSGCACKGQQHVLVHSKSKVPSHLPRCLQEPQPGPHLSSR